MDNLDSILDMLKENNQPLEINKFVNVKFNTKPLISILLPIYNAAQYLKDCLDSIFNQTYQNFEKDNPQDYYLPIYLKTL